MKALNLVTLLLVVVGGVNWGLVANLDLVAAIFGTGSAPARLVYLLVGLSALYQLIPFSRAISRGEVPAEAGVAGRH